MSDIPPEIPTGQPSDKPDDKPEPRHNEDPALIAIKNRILDLWLPPNNKKIKEIAIIINRSRSFVYYKLQDLVTEGRLEKLDSGHIKRIIPESQILGYADVMKSDFHQYKTIERWITRMKRDKVANWAYYVTYLYKICKTLQRPPDHFLAPIEQVESMMEEFEEKFHRGEGYVINKGHPKNQTPKDDTSIAHYIKAVRNFRQRLGQGVPKNIGGVFAIVHKAGQYGTLKLTDAERQKGIEFMEKISNDLRKVFVMDNETGMRTDTLFKQKPVFERKLINVDGKDCEYYVFNVTEKKQNTQYEKILMTPEARKIAREHQAGKPLFFDGKGDWMQKKLYNESLRKFFEEIGKIEFNGEGKPKHYELGTNEHYLIHFPSHFIRHSWAHWMMRCSGYRADVVSRFAWEDSKTLSKIYAKSNVESILSQGLCDYCNATKEKDPNYNQFCSLRHAIAWYNGLNPSATKPTPPTSPTELPKNPNIEEPSQIQLPEDMKI